MGQLLERWSSGTVCRCWGLTSRCGLNIYGRVFWARGPHARWQFMMWLPGVRIRWGNADLDFEPLTPENELELMGWGIPPAGVHDHA